jgi:hypothetical protein
MPPCTPPALPSDDDDDAEIPWVLLDEQTYVTNHIDVGILRCCGTSHKQHDDQHRDDATDDDFYILEHEVHFVLRPTVCLVL